MDETRIVDDLRGSVEGAPVEGLIERLADKIGARANVQAVFGDPVSRDSVTIIPVARVRWGFGGGSGKLDEPTSGPASGDGGGGGVIADPMGYIEMGPAGTAYRAINGPYPSALVLIASGVSAAIVLRALARLLGR